MRPSIDENVLGMPSTDGGVDVESEIGVSSVPVVNAADADSFFMKAEDSTLVPGVVAALEFTGHGVAGEAGSESLVHVGAIKPKDRAVDASRSLRRLI